MTVKIIIVSSTSSALSRSFNINTKIVTLVSVLTAGLFITIGFFLGWFLINVNFLGSLTVNELQRWQKDILEQQAEIEFLRDNTDMELDALSLQLAQIQSQVLKLGSLGERLVILTGTKSNEFDFSPPASQGEPDDVAEIGIHFQPPEFLSIINQLAIRVDRREEQLHVLENILLDREYEDAIYIAGRPIKKGWMSSAYGRRIDPFTGRPAWHKGVDFAGKEGAEVIAVGSGVITWADTRGGYGNLVEINHGEGVVTRYGHNKEILVNVGDIITKGQVISLMGSTGRSTGAHVHFEVIINGRQVNPSRYIYRAKK